MSPHSHSNSALGPDPVLGPDPALDPCRMSTVDAFAGHARRGSAAGHARRGLLAVGAGSALWGTTGVVVGSVQAWTDLSAAAIGCYRLAVAAAVLTVVRPVTVLSGVRSALCRPWLLLASGAGLGLYQVLYFLGVQEAGVSIATLVSIGFAPVVTTVLAAVGRRRRPDAGALAVLTAAVGGLVLVSVPGTASGGGRGSVGLGLLASIGAGVGYGVTVLLNRRVAAQVDALTMTVVTSAVGAVVLAPVALAIGPVRVDDPRGLVGLLYLGAVCTAVAYGLFYAGLRTTTGEAAVVVTLLEPLTATVLAVVLLGERLSWVTGLGGALMLVSIAVLYRRSS